MTEKEKFIWEKSARGFLGSRQIAKAFSRRNDQITKIIRNYYAFFREFGEVKEKTTRSGGRPVVEFFLNENQTLFLISLLGNSKEVIKSKYKLIKHLQGHQEARDDLCGASRPEPCN